MNGLENFKAVQKKAFEISDGDIDKVDLTCPRCGHSPMVFSFAWNRPPALGLYIHCKHCDLLVHAHLDSPPPNFREDLILPEYQELEDQAMLFADSLGNPDLKNNQENNKK